MINNINQSESSRESSKSTTKKKTESIKKESETESSKSNPDIDIQNSLQKENTNFFVTYENKSTIVIYSDDFVIGSFNTRQLLKYIIKDNDFLKSIDTSQSTPLITKFFLNVGDNPLDITFVSYLEISIIGNITTIYNIFDMITNYINTSLENDIQESKNPSILRHVCKKLQIMLMLHALFILERIGDSKNKSIFEHSQKITQVLFSLITQEQKLILEEQNKLKKDFENVSTQNTLLVEKLKIITKNVDEQNKQVNEIILALEEDNVESEKEDENETNKFSGYGFKNDFPSLTPKK